MRWGVYGVMLLIAIVLDTSFMPVFSIGAVRPALTPCVATFICLHAPRGIALWAAFLAGLAVDLTSPALDAGARPYHLLGPSALGYVLGANLVFPLRTMVFRRNPLALGVLTALFGMASTLVVVAILTVRGWWSDPSPPWFPSHSAAAYLGGEALDHLWSGAFAVVAAFVLNATIPLWGFATGTTRAARRGAA